ncbi:MAG: tRNA1(Val) (adenine(37)-N6)-methyltransferase [Firmicutes bacterium]|nr:tRNA1(Val) (adenine(37)-N6)-methyltransferase [Bacillota bacterium]
MAVRVDEIGFGGLKLLQDTESFCYGVDSVLLADLCRAGRGDSVLDLCSGNGVVSFIVMAKYGPASITGIEIQEAAVDLARRSAELNGLQDRVSFLCADAADISEHVGPSSFDAAVCNPPYFEMGSGVPSESSARHLARHEGRTGLVGFLGAAAYALKNGGQLFMIHRPERLADIMYHARDCGLEPKTMRMVCPYSGKAPNMVLLRFVKGGKKELTVLPDLIVRDPDGSYTEEINSIYGR